ncbi:uncharacterized protein PEZ65_015076 isoform 1-T1 [Lycodopsis pacificus]
MTSWTYMTHIFVLVFLNVIDLSKEGCYDHLDMEDWAKDKHLNDTFFLVTTKDPKDRVKCSLEAECLRKENGIGCNLLHQCPQENNTQCEGNSTEVHLYHFMCFMAKAFDHPLKGCEYNTVCKIFADTASTPSDLTTTATTTLTTTTPSTTTPTTTLPETTKLPPESSFPQVENNETETLRLRENLKETQKETDKLKMLLGLSLVLHVIVPLAVFLYMRHRWRRDRMHSSLIQMCNGNLTADPPRKESDAPPAFLDKDAEDTRLIKRDKHSDSGEDHTQL